MPAFAGMTPHNGIGPLELDHWLVFRLFHLVPISPALKCFEFTRFAWFWPTLMWVPYECARTLARPQAVARSAAVAPRPRPREREVENSLPGFVREGLHVIGR